MKKLCLILVFCLMATQAYGAVSVEEILNNVYDSSTGTLKATTSGGSSSTFNNVSVDGTLAVSGDAVLYGQIRYDVDKYVVCDTFTSAGINACIDLLGAEGGEVYLPEGDYDCTAVIQIDQANTTIRGAGKGTRLLATNRFVYSTVTGTPAAGETLTGDTTGYTATVAQVDLTNKIVWYHSISNAANFNTAEVISWSGAADTTLVGAPTEQTFDVIDTGGKDDIIVSDLQIVGGSGGGNNKMLIDYASTTVRGLIANCWLSESDAEGIKIQGTFIKVIGNYIEQCDGVMLSISNGTRCVIDSNILANSPNAGMSIGSAVSTTVSNNILKDITTIAIDSNNSSTNNTFIGNTLEGCKSYGIKIRGTYNTVMGNTITNTDTGFADIQIISDFNTIIGNTCYGDGTSDKGIYLDEADQCIVTGNITANHDVAGIQEDSDCQDNSIYGNNVQDGYVINGLNNTFAISSTDAVAVAGGEVGKVAIVSGDGSVCYIKLWSEN